MQRGNISSIGLPPAIPGPARTVATVKNDTIELGTPGGHALVLARAARRDVLIASTGSAALALLALVAVTNFIAVSFLAGVAVAGAIWWARERSIDYARAMSGVRSERTVAKALRRCATVGVANGAMIGGGGDVDHIVLGPCCVAVETKTGRGEVTVTKNGLTAGGRRIKGDPVGQVTRQAASLRKITGVYAEAVVCISGMEGPPLHHRTATICGPGDLHKVIAGAPAVLDDATARHLMSTLVSKVDVETAAPKR